jgi:hypothetical protein
VLDKEVPCGDDDGGGGVLEGVRSEEELLRLDVVAEAARALVMLK